MRRATTSAKIPQLIPLSFFTKREKGAGSGAGVAARYLGVTERAITGAAGASGLMAGLAGETPGAPARGGVAAAGGLAAGRRTSGARGALGAAAAAATRTGAALGRAGGVAGGCTTGGFGGGLGVPGAGVTTDGRPIAGEGAGDGAAGAGLGAGGGSGALAATRCGALRLIFSSTRPETHFNVAKIPSPLMATASKAGAFHRFRAF